MNQPGAPYRGRRLVRSSTERMWTGVSGGIAEYFDVDPVLVRLVWVAAAILTGGLAILLYIALWIIMPREDQVGRRGFSEGWNEVSSQLQEDARRVADEARRFTDDLRESGRAASETTGEGPYTRSADAEGSTVEEETVHRPTTAAPTAAPPYQVRPEGERSRHRTAGLILVVLGLIFLASEVGIFRWVQWQVVWPLILVGIGVALLARRRD